MRAADAANFLAKAGMYSERLVTAIPAARLVTMAPTDSAIMLSLHRMAASNRRHRSPAPEHVPVSLMESVDTDLRFHTTVPAVLPYIYGLKGPVCLVCLLSTSLSGDPFRR